VHLHLPAAVLARLNVALGFSQSLLRKLPRIGDASSIRRNEPIKFVIVEMFVKWPSQNQLLLVNTILPG
jgi:hypothetical protein